VSGQKWQTWYAPSARSRLEMEELDQAISSREPRSFRPRILCSIATVNRLLDRFGFSVQSAGGNEILIRIGSECVRLQRLH
jgi:hypothetical protein